MAVVARILLWLMVAALAALSEAAHDPAVWREYLPQSPFRVVTPELAGIAVLLALAGAVAKPGARFHALLCRPDFRELRALWRPLLAAIALMEGSRAALGYIENWRIINDLAELNWESRIMTAGHILRYFAMAAAAWRLLRPGAPNLAWRGVGLASAALAFMISANIFWHSVQYMVLGWGDPRHYWFFNPGPVTVDVVAFWVGIALARGTVCGPADPRLPTMRWAAYVVYLFFSYRLLSSAYSAVNLRLSLDIHLSQPVFWPNVAIYVVAFIIALGHALRATRCLGYRNQP